MAECKDEFLDLMPSRRDETTFSDGRKSALPEDCDRARIVLRCSRVERAHVDAAHELAKRRSGKPFAPELWPELVADLRQIAPRELADVAGDLPSDGDGSDLDARINQLPTPVGTESLVVLWRARATGFAVGEEFIHIEPCDRPQ